MRRTVGVKSRIVVQAVDGISVGELVDVAGTRTAVGDTMAVDTRKTFGVGYFGKQAVR